MPSRCFLPIVIATLCCSGCEDINAPVVGRYRATIEVSGHELPFFIDVARENERFVLILPNAGERLRIGDVQVDGRALHARLPSNSTLSVTASRSHLRGTLTIKDKRGASHTLPLEAELGEPHLFYDEALSDNADVEGRWDVMLQTNSGDRTNAVALLDQQYDRIVGTLVLDSGQQHALHGQVHDEELQLASLSWSDARLFKLKLTSRGALEGDAWQLSGVRHSVKATRNSESSLDATQARAVEQRSRSST